MKPFEKYQNENIQFDELICNNCKYYNKDLTCKAFPNGIPFSIINKNNHSSPIEGQKNNIVFEKK